MLVSPSILSADFSKLAADLKTVDKSDMLHIDVMDGVFVPNISFGMPIISSIRDKFDITFDVHLMITDPLPDIEDFKKAGADIITVHYEAKNAEESLKKIKKLGLKAGLSLKPATKVSEIESLLPLCDLVLVMTVEPGFGGQKLIPECVGKATELKKIREEKGYSYIIEADGGINLQNYPSLGEAGVDCSVMGSAVFGIEAGERNAKICSINGKEI